MKSSLIDSGHLDALEIGSAGQGETMPVSTLAECKGTRQTPAPMLCLQRERRIDVELTGTRRCQLGAWGICELRCGPFSYRHRRAAALI